MALKHRIIYFVMLSIFPVLLGITAVEMNKARGPYWLGTNLDPEYVYLLNSDNLAGLKGVGHIDHPGTPVQVLGAVTIRATYLLSGENTDIHTDVLKRPEFYLDKINIVMVCLEIIMLFITGFILYTYTKSIGAALWFQLSLFFSIVILKSSLTRVTPEPLLFLSSIAMASLVVFLTFKKEYDPVPRTTFILLAAVTGFGIACKITFLPMLAIPFFLLPGIRSKIFYILCSGIAFVVFTLPIIRMYDRFFGWITLLLSHSGHYGNGPSGLITAGRFADHIKQLLSHNLFFTLSLVSGLIIMGVVVVVPRFRRPIMRTSFFKTLSILVFTQLAGLIMVSKHAADHYLLPVLCLSGLTFLFVFYVIKEIVSLKLSQFKLEGSYFYPSTILAVLALFLLFNPLNSISSGIKNLEKTKTESLALHQEMNKRFKGFCRIYYYTGSSMEYALKFGDDLSRSYHSQTLETLYKDVYFYDIWTKRFTRFNYNKEIPFEEIRGKYGDRIVFQGTPGLSIPGILLEKVAIHTDCRGRESFYRLKM